MTNAFDSSHRKLVRALVPRQAILDHLATFNDSKPFETFLKPESEHEHWRPTASPPDELSILLGEFLYQVRSALDHGFFALVAAEKGPAKPSGDWQRRVEFPLIHKRPQGIGTPAARKQVLGSACDWLSDEAFAFIEGVQPYYRSKDPNDSLRALGVLSNIDKHRRFALSTLGVEIRDVNKSEKGTITTLSWTFETEKELVPLSSPPEMADVPTNLKRDITPVLAFDEPELGPPQTARVSDTVLEIWHAAWWVGGRLAQLGNSKTP